MKKFLISLLLFIGGCHYGPLPPTIVYYNPLTGAQQIDDGTNHYHGDPNRGR